jgi:hypothetical protein
VKKNHYRHFYYLLLLQLAYGHILS